MSAKMKAVTDLDVYMMLYSVNALCALMYFF